MKLKFVRIVTLDGEELIKRADLVSLYHKDDNYVAIIFDPDGTKLNISISADQYKTLSYFLVNVL